MGAKKQKTPESEKDRVKLAKAITDKGFEISDRNAAANRSDMRYKGDGLNATSSSASKAIAMKSAIKANRSKGQRSLATNTVASAKGDAGQFSIAARSGITNVERRAKGAQSGVNSAANVLSLANTNAQQANAKEHSKWVDSNKRRQGAMDLAALGVTSGLEYKWDADAKAKVPDTLRESLSSNDEWSLGWMK